MDGTCVARSLRRSVARARELGTSRPAYTSVCSGSGPGVELSSVSAGTGALPHVGTPWSVFGRPGRCESPTIARPERSGFGDSFREAEAGLPVDAERSPVLQLGRLAGPGVYARSGP
jgi:hypothetical protein